MSRIREIISLTTQWWHQKTAPEEKYVRVPRVIFDIALEDVMQHMRITANTPDTIAQAMEEVSKAILLSNFRAEESPAHSLTALSCRELAQVIKNSSPWQEHIDVPQTIAYEFYGRFATNVIPWPGGEKTDTWSIIEELDNEVRRRLCNMAEKAVLSETMTKVNDLGTDILYKNQVILLNAAKPIAKYLFPYLIPQTAHMVTLPKDRHIALENAL